jgi:hypothetical protein
MNDGRAQGDSVTDSRPHLYPPPLAFVKAKMAVQKKRMGRASALHDMRLKIMLVISLETHLYRCIMHGSRPYILEIASFLFQSV